MADRPGPTIELGTLEDVRRVAEVHVRSRACAYRELVPASIMARDTIERRVAQWTKRLSDAEGRLWLASRGSDVIGFAYTAPARDDELDAACGEVRALYLLEDWTGRGLGRTLLAHALEELWGRGCPEVVLWCAEENGRALRFYQRMGFTLDPRVSGSALGDTGLTKRRLRSMRD